MREQDPQESEFEETERVLRALADQESEGSLPAPDDERLRAYREGRLRPHESRELERVLARSEAGRRRLLALAGIDQSLPLRRVRRAVLGRTKPRRAVRLSAAAVAAMIALALTAVLSRPRVLPEGLAYEVSARGLAEVRSAGETPGVARVYPDTTLRILLQPQGDASAGLSFALYRREGALLRRVREPEEVRLESDRGAAAFSGTASRVLATEAPGVYPLFVLVSADRDLPFRVEIEPGQDVADALQDSGRLVYPVTVTLLIKEETP